MIARLILVPLGLCVAAAGAFVTLAIAALANPDIGVLLGEVLARLVDMGLGAASGDGHAAMQMARFAGASWKLLFAVIFFPSLLIAVVSEVFARRSLLLQVIGTAALTAAMPFALLPKTLHAGGLPHSVLTMLAIAGAVAGALYWLIAGRSAGLSAPARAGS